jgi:hypothetical protein
MKSFFNLSSHAFFFIKSKKRRTYWWFLFERRKYRKNPFSPWHMQTWIWTWFLVFPHHRCPSRLQTDRCRGAATVEPPWTSLFFIKDDDYSSINADLTGCFVIYRLNKKNVLIIFELNNLLNVPQIGLI